MICSLRKTIGLCLYLSTLHSVLVIFQLFLLSVTVHTTVSSFINFRHYHIFIMVYGD